ncbi:hypothetical protein CGJ57_24105 [Vibrio parahaemolyticus]|nr:hypothetical protein CGJ57_24105 [Vibrio parahaemolyticus]
MYNKAFKSDSQRLALSLRSSIAKRRSHLNAALCINLEFYAVFQNFCYTRFSGWVCIMVFQVRFN